MNFVEYAVLEQGPVAQSHVFSVEFASRPSAVTVFDIESDVAILELAILEAAVGKCREPDNQSIE